MSEFDKRCKDSDPVKTINTIRSILNELGILTVEKWNHSIDGLYALRITIAGTNIGTNGKGTTPAFALASAYGEFMERLQNKKLPNAQNFFPPEADEPVFFYAPDERYLTIEDLLEEDNPFTRFIIPFPIEFDDKKQVNENFDLEKEFLIWAKQNLSKELRIKTALKWKGQGIEPDKWKITTLPFYNVRSQKLDFLPYQMARMSLGSNGMCAGNTPHEAIVQGLCEILERYAHTEALAGRLTPPSIPGEYLENYPILLEIIKRIEDRGSFKVIVKDCSMGKSFPVLATIIINKDTQGYFVTFGSHPVFAIALERCLTESFQGHDLINAKYDFSYYKHADTDAYSMSNKNNSFTIGSSKYPDRFFLKNSDYEFTPWKMQDSCDNKTTLKRLFNIVLSQGYDILIRDFSHLEFPTFWVIIPGISEIDIFVEGEDTFFYLFHMRPKVQNIMANISGAKPEDLAILSDYILKRSQVRNEVQNLAQVVGLPLKRSHPWNKIPSSFLLCQIFYKTGNLDNAIKLLDKMINISKGNDLTYYRCVRDFLSIKKEDKKGDSDKKDKSMYILELFYPKETLDLVKENWKSSEKILDNYESFPCPDCQSCSSKQDCNFIMLKDIFMKIRKEEALRNFDQLKLTDYFI